MLWASVELLRSSSIFDITLSDLPAMAPPSTPAPQSLGRPAQIAIVAGAALALGGGVLWHHWQPQQQLQTHTQAFLNAVEDQKWDRVGELMAADYQDGWGLDKASALSYGEQTFQHFATLSFNLLDMTATAHTDHQGQVRTRFEVRGIGSPMAALTRSEINGLDQPFVFHWQRQSWKPYDWQLVKIENSALELDLSQFD